uniref:Uncharacterized protein n=1 Tax=Anguilla anguilla TaxID=7936 RepID=A0A0E9WN82_ANGAN
MIAVTKLQRRMPHVFLNRFAFKAPEWTG